MIEPTDAEASAFPVAPPLIAGAVATPPRPPVLTMQDLRFFATCYIAGLAFFLLMLS